MVSLTTSASVFACYSAACRPPTSGGTGGSGGKAGKGGGGSKAAPASSGKASFKGSTVLVDGQRVAGITSKRGGFTARLYAKHGGGTVTGRTKAELADRIREAMSGGAKGAAKKDPVKKTAPAKKSEVEVKSAPVKGGKPTPVSIDAMAKIIKDTVTKGDLSLKTEAELEKMDFDDTVKVLKALGVSGNKPQVVSAAELAAMEKADPDSVLARSAPAKAHKELETAADIPLKLGDAYYGEGVYFAAGKGAAKHVTDSYGGAGKTTTKVMVDQSSIADHAFIKQALTRAQYLSAGLKPYGKASKEMDSAARLIADAFKKSGVKADAYGQSNSGAMYSVSIAAAMLGYKGVRIKNPILDDKRQTVDYVNIFDRSALTVAG